MHALAALPLCDSKPTIEVLTSARVAVASPKSEGAAAAIKFGGLCVTVSNAIFRFPSYAATSPWLASGFRHAPTTR